MTNRKNEVLYWQNSLTVNPPSRGFHLITEEVRASLTQMPAIDKGILNLFLQHTSASLTVSENYCPEVRTDLENHYNTLAPEDNRLYQHTIEGPDDMPAHIKSTHLGVSLTLPIQNSQIALGQWQGIFLCEHRNHPSHRTILLTAHGITS